MHCTAECGSNLKCIINWPSVIFNFLSRSQLAVRTCYIPWNQHAFLRNVKYWHRSSAKRQTTNNITSRETGACRVSAYIRQPTATKDQIANLNHCQIIRLCIIPIATHTNTQTQRMHTYKSVQATGYEIFSDYVSVKTEKRRENSDKKKFLRISLRANFIQ